jgi:serine/threonine-protein kinase RsbT
MSDSASSDAIFAVQITDGTVLTELRRRISDAAKGLKFGLVETTKLLTATNELARNIIVHAGAGNVRLEAVREGHRSGLRLCFEDSGPGIANIDLAMQDGYTSGKGMGMGLPGTRRLVHEFSIESEVGRGTRIVIVMWKR